MQQQQPPHADGGMCTCRSAAALSQLNESEVRKYHLLIIDVLESDACCHSECG